MGRLEEEHRLERIYQGRKDPYHSFQSYFGKLDEASDLSNKGEMAGKRYKRLTSAQYGLNILFNHYLNKPI